MTRANRKKRFKALGLIIFVLLTVQSLASGTTHYINSRESVLLPISSSFLAPDSYNSLVLYRLADMSPVRSFRTPDRMKRYCITSDEKLLLIFTEGNDLHLFELLSGKLQWTIPSSESGFIGSGIVNFSSKGNRFVATDESTHLSIYETATKRRISRVEVPNQELILSADLSPDGSQCIISTIMGKCVYSYDTSLSKLAETGIGGFGYLRYSADGKFILYNSLTPAFGSDSAQRVYLIDSASAKSVLDFGVIAEIGMMRPTADGGFLITGFRRHRGSDSEQYYYRLEGLRWRPGAQELEEVWFSNSSDNDNVKADFLPDKSIALWTNYRFVTSIIDFRTQKLLGKINNSTNYQLEESTSYSPGLLQSILNWLYYVRPSSHTMQLLAIAAAAISIAIWLSLRRRRS
jgi:WD40 repeat protein